MRVKGSWPLSKSLLKYPLIEFLNKLYFDLGSFSFDEDQYREILRDLHCFTISSQAYCLLNQKGRLQETPYFFQEQLRGVFNRTLYQNWLIKNETDKILQALEENKIEVIILKGVYFAERYFGHMGARGTSDIDLLVKPESLPRAAEIINKMDYVDKDKITAGYHYTYYHESQSANNMSVELHWDIFHERESSLNMNRFWMESIPVNDWKYIKELNAVHSLYAICIHGVKHSFLSMKYLIDILQIITCNPYILDEPELQMISQEDNADRMITAAISIVGGVFPQLTQQIPSNLKVDRYIWDYDVMRRASLGKKGIEYYRYRIVLALYITGSWLWKVNYLKRTSAVMLRKLYKKLSERMNNLL